MLKIAQQSCQSGLTYSKRLTFRNMLKSTWNQIWGVPHKLSAFLFWTPSKHLFFRGQLALKLRDVYIESRWWFQMSWKFSPRSLGRFAPIWRGHIFQLGWFNQQRSGIVKVIYLRMLPIPTWNNVSLPGGHCYYPKYTHSQKCWLGKSPCSIGIYIDSSTHSCSPFECAFSKGHVFSIRRGKFRNVGARCPHATPEPTDVRRVTVRWRDNSFIPEPKWSQVEKVQAAQWVKRCAWKKSLYKRWLMASREIRVWNVERLIWKASLLGCKNSYYGGWTESR